MKIRALKYCLIITVLAACGDNNTSENDIGQYKLTFPTGFKLVKKNGTDSYVGEITYDTTSISFDYGYYSNSLDPSLVEYVNEDIWKRQVYLKQVSNGKNHGINKAIFDIHLINYNLDKSGMYQLQFEYKGDSLEYHVHNPRHLNDCAFIEDTIDGHYKKIVISNQHDNSYIGLYMKDLNGYNESINSYPALSMYFQNPSESEIQMLTDVFMTCRPIEK